MLVSVIIPTYNRETTLPRALKSAFAQKGVFYEVLVVDDGSTDGTAKWVQEMAQRRSDVRYLYESNQGPAATRNVGIREARGEFIAFLDSDDEWLPGKLARQLRFFKENPDYLVCQTEEIWIRNGRRVNSMTKHKKFGGWIFEKSLPLTLVSPSAVMMRRKFFDEVGLFDESFPACEDYDLWLRASLFLPFGLIEKPYVVKYGGHSDQRSKEFPVMDGFRIKALCKILESDKLTPSQREAAFHELRKKCEIVSQGALKRGKIDESQYYKELPERIHEQTLSA